MKQNNIRNIMPALEYEAYTSTFLKPWDDMFLKRCKKNAPVSTEKPTLLDVGTGTGVLLERLYETPGFENYTFIGIDYYEDNVIEANDKFTERGLSDRISVKEGDAHYLDFESETFDMVISRATLHHLVDPVKALQEKYRVLKPNGICLIHDMKRDVSEEVLAEFNALRKKANYPPTVVSEKYTVKEIEEFLEQAGLAHCSSVGSDTTGLSSLGYEVIIKKLQ
ncbi:class I SAM-dependent methyltransferase [Flavobacterium collinsii]|uniref:2-methoxy-6-polyprenyl-1,4-benzoquinol methylase, mitochondrial n=1 Tax=Flavobacterium collinsii TaxID=1114861 RepID=A0ABM8KNM8_9FLAO|nr:class I SAM-dependent methyltransferase [Flavobacterium collinsii]CAA9202062.1 2-methoxy-6-polyprenyl-1,4-benzoquinol methylase, mitochondrial [Flavobacterium collinsii]